MLQEGTIAIPGTVDQVVFDFGELRQALAGAGKLLNVLDKPSPWWDIWEKAVIEILISGALSEEVIDALDKVDAPWMVACAIKFVGSINRAALIKRIQGYGAAVLSEAEFREVVVVPQIAFDFNELSAMTDDQELIEVGAHYRDLVIAGDCLEPGETINPQFLTLCNALDYRPLYRDRMCCYFAGLTGVVIGPPEVILDPDLKPDLAPALAPDGGLPATLLDDPLAL